MSFQYRICMNIILDCFFVSDRDECSTFPCFNGGTCENTPTGYECTCAPGSTGASCEKSNKITHSYVIDQLLCKI